MKALLSTLCVMMTFYTYSIAQCELLVWADEFDGTSLDTDKWSYQTGAGGWGNNELQYYTDRADNVTVNTGFLEIIALEESYMGADYTSGRIRTIGNGDWTYGRFEARLKTPFGRGIWPAFWMMPTDNFYGTWPASGEMDIMELLGHQTDIAYGTCHYGVSNDHQQLGSNFTLSSGEFSEDFHTFALEWTANALKWYIDDNLYFSISDLDVAPYEWVFDQDFHFILNVAVGGNWPGNPNGATTFPQALEVDYVRVYQHLPDIKIQGDDYVHTSDLTRTYSLPNVSGSSYFWTVPNGATITSGQSTNEIQVTFGSTGGNVACTFSSDCGTETKSIPVEVNDNFWQNPDFEEDYAHWTNRTSGGGAATFLIETTDIQQGLQSAHVDVTTAATNPWDIQLSRSGFSLVSGTLYTLSFWAKANTNGVQLPVAFINPNDFTWYAGSTYTLTDTWTNYTLEFEAPASTEVLFNLDLGSAVAEFYFDDFSFSRSNLLPVDLLTFSARQVPNKNEVQLDWVVTNAFDAHFYDIEFSNNDLQFEKIARINGFSSGVTEQQYTFIHRNPVSDINYYRLKQVDLNGDFMYSPVIAAEYTKKERPLVFPNPATEYIYLPINGRTTLTIYTATGKLIKEDIIEGNGNELYDIATLVPGAYLINCIHNGQSQSFLFLKE